MGSGTWPQKTGKATLLYVSGKSRSAFHAGIIGLSRYERKTVAANSFGALVNRTFELFLGNVSRRLLANERLNQKTRSLREALAASQDARARQKRFGFRLPTDSREREPRKECVSFCYLSKRRASLMLAAGYRTLLQSVTHSPTERGVILKASEDSLHNGILRMLLK